MNSDININSVFFKNDSKNIMFFYESTQKHYLFLVSFFNYKIDEKKFKPPEKIVLHCIENLITFELTLLSLPISENLMITHTPHKLSIRIYKTAFYIFLKNNYNNKNYIDFKISCKENCLHEIYNIMHMESPEAIYIHHK